MGDNEDFFFGTDNDVNMYWNGTYFCIDGLNAEIRIDFATAALITIYGGITAGDDLVLRCNTAESYPRIFLPGGAGATIYSSDFTLHTGTDYIFIANITGADTVIMTGDNNKNIYLNPHGTGLVKFGTSVGTGDVVCNGYVTILDNAGAACKLMRCA
jgi:hypothetical protein